MIVNEYYLLDIFQRIKLMMRQSVDSKGKGLQEPALEGLPLKQEWAIINKYKALEFQRMKQRQHLIDRQKKEQFRRQLDNQLNSRNNAQEQQRQQDRMYYQQLSQQAEEQRQKEEANKRDKFNLRRRVDSENIHKVEEGRNSRLRDGDTGYHLEIGMKSEVDHKVKADHFRKEMMDTLDLQLRQKQEEQKMSKIRNQLIQEEHKRAQDSYFKPQNRKHYSQNQKIYEYYQELDHQKQLRDKEMELKFVEEAHRRKEMEDIEREKEEQAKRLFTKEIVKDTLGMQVKQLRRKRVDEKTTNPEQVSYGFMSSVFESKYKGYNKQQYKKDLERQAEQQRLKKIKENHMSDEEYRLNINQLSKAVVGDYAQNQYLDRSLGAIGNHEKYQLDRLNLGSQDKDVDIIKHRLENLRHKGNLSTIQ